MTASYFLLQTVNMQTASDIPHGGPDPDYCAEETVPAPPPGGPEQQ